MLGEHIPSPTTYALRRSLREQFPHSADITGAISEEYDLGQLNEVDESALILRLDTLDRFLRISFRSKIHNILIDTRPIYYTSDDAVYETGIFGDGDENVPVIVHGTDPDVQSFAVRKAKCIHDKAVELAEKGYSLRTIYEETVKIV